MLPSSHISGSLLSCAAMYYSSQAKQQPEHAERESHTLVARTSDRAARLPVRLIFSLASL